MIWITNELPTKFGRNDGDQQMMMMTAVWGVAARLRVKAKPTPKGAFCSRAVSCRILILNQDVEATFDIDAMRKDLRKMLQESQARQISLPVAAQRLAAFDEASAAGLGERDCAYMPAYWVGRTER
jgi:hypothetical protein